MAAILVVMAGVGSEVTLAVPPPMVVEEERREIGLPISLDGGAHGLPAWSELEGSGGTMTRLEVEQMPTSCGVLAVDIPFSGEEDTRVELPAILPSQELVMIRSSDDTVMAGSSSGSGVTHELVWPYLGELGKT